MPGSPELVPLSKPSSLEPPQRGLEPRLLFSIPELIIFLVRGTVRATINRANVVARPDMVTSTELLDAHFKFSQYRMCLGLSHPDLIAISSRLF